MILLISRCTFSQWGTVACPCSLGVDNNGGCAVRVKDRVNKRDYIKRERARKCRRDRCSFKGDGLSTEQLETLRKINQ